MKNMNNSRITSALKVITGKRVLIFLALSFLLSISPAKPSWADINPHGDAMKIAAAVPGKQEPDKQETIRPARGDIEDAAAATISSVLGIMDLMKQAQELSAALPPAKPSAVKPQTPERESALLIAMKTPDAPSRAKNAKPAPAAEPAKTALARPRVESKEPFKTAIKPRVSLPDGKRLIWPVGGSIYSGFNATRGKRQHGAVDIVTARGTPIAAAANGIVSVASNGGKEFSGYGKIIILDHGKGLYTVYGHCDKLLVKMGQKVKAGEYIATVGRTGRATTDHCHFEVRLAGKKYDPMAYLPYRPDVVKATNYHSPKRKK